MYERSHMNAAQQLGNQYIPQTGLAGTPVQLRLNTLEESLNIALTSAQALQGRLYSLGNRLIGSQPEPVEKSTAEPPSDAAVRRLERFVEQITATLESASAHLSRIEQL